MTDRKVYGELGPETHEWRWVVLGLAFGLVGAGAGAGAMECRRRPKRVEEQGAGGEEGERRIRRSIGRDCCCVLCANMERGKGYAESERFKAIRLHGGSSGWPGREREHET